MSMSSHCKFECKVFKKERFWIDKNTSYDLLYLQKVTGYIASLEIAITNQNFNKLKLYMLLDDMVKYNEPTEYLTISKNNLLLFGVIGVGVFDFKDVSIYIRRWKKHGNTVNIKITPAEDKSRFASKIKLILVNTDENKQYYIDKVKLVYYLKR